MAGASSEKDSIRILMICLACLLMSTLRLVVLNAIASASLQWSDVPKTIFYWTSFGAYLLALCTEEILLAFLVADFRKNLKRQFFAIFCCCNFCCNSESNGANGSSSTKTQPLTIGLTTRTTPAKPMNNLVNGV
jgi:hypothetical protein